MYKSGTSINVYFTGGKKTSQELLVQQEIKARTDFFQWMETKTKRAKQTLGRVSEEWHTHN